VKLYSYHRYVVIDEVEYELDATKVAASVKPCSAMVASSFLTVARDWPS
jgi:hypothetical protein